MSAAGWVIIALSLALSAVVLLLTIAWVHIVSLRDSFDEQHDANHAKCIAHIADFTSKRVVALAFRDAAERYDSAREANNLKQIRRGWRDGGPTVPARWLIQQADLLDPPVEPLDLTTLSGDHA